MPLAEFLAIELGQSITKSILKLWLKDSSLAQDISSNLVDVLKTRITSNLDQRRAQRQLEIIGEKIGENLFSIFEIEGTNLDEGSRTAVAQAVAETFNKLRISSELLAEQSLDAQKLAVYVKSV